MQSAPAGRRVPLCCQENSKCTVTNDFGPAFQRIIAHSMSMCILTNDFCNASLGMQLCSSSSALVKQCVSVGPTLQQCSCGTAYVQPTSWRCSPDAHCFLQMFRVQLWRLEFVKAWKLLIRHKVLNSTGANSQPIGLQLVMPEWHLRAAFESDSLAKAFITTYEKEMLVRSMQSRMWRRWR